jgi:phosphoribosyl 1,2-cyclic phosphodiesterase
VPVTLIDDFADLDVLAIESNYDPEMQRTSGRPFFLQQRIMGGKGHLSNQQAFDAVRAVLDRCERSGVRLPSHIVLLHRSRECNCPKLLRRIFARDARVAPRLTLAEQFESSGWLKIRDRAPLAGEQLSLAWG